MFLIAARVCLDVLIFGGTAAVYITLYLLHRQQPNGSP